MEVTVGHVSHYYNHLGVAAVEIESDNVKVGDTIHVKGHSTDFVQPVESIELEHHHINQAAPGQSIGIKVKDRVHEHDTITKVLPD